jgi:DNA (cytosine-5)-methyltransferase 1
MTCSGGQNYHPCGTRDFTIREYACLQGFPPNHLFRGSYVKKQIGNAVPPSVAKVLFESIKKALDRADGIVEEHEVIVIDDL